MRIRAGRGFYGARAGIASNDRPTEAPTHNRPVEPTVPERSDVELVGAGEDLGVQIDERRQPRRRAEPQLEGEPRARIQARRL